MQRKLTFGLLTLGFMLSIILARLGAADTATATVPVVAMAVVPDYYEMP